MKDADCVLLDSPQQAKQWLKPHHQAKLSIGFVATMGALHDGHLSLVEKAREENKVVCVSIFVNPLQFNNPDDLEKYPRDLEQDRELLEQIGCDMIFTGTLENFFPEIQPGKDIPLEDPGLFAKDLEAEFRPGHFAGVKTIVKRLFETVGQCKAYFGAKDFQQTLVVKSLTKEMGYPEIIVCPTQREANGLAMSSRNQRLTEKEKQIAGKIFQALSKASLAWQAGERSTAKLKTIMSDELEHPLIEVEYTELRDPANWTEQANNDILNHPPQALIAANIGNVRLIDNAFLGKPLVI